MAWDGLSSFSSSLAPACGDRGEPGALVKGSGLAGSGGTLGSPGGVLGICAVLTNLAKPGLVTAGWRILARM